MTKQERRKYITYNLDVDDDHYDNPRRNIILPLIIICWGIATTILAVIAG